MLTFDFRNQLLGDWPTAKGFLVAQLDRLYAALVDPSIFLQNITTNPITGVASVPISGPITFQDGLFATGSGLVGPVSFSANQNNFNPAGLAKCLVLLLNPTTTGLHMTGIVDPISLGTADNRLMYLVNVGSYDLILDGSSASSNQASQFATAIFPTINVTLKPNEGTWLFHHGQWLIMSYGQAVTAVQSALVSLGGVTYAAAANASGAFLSRPDLRRVAGFVGTGTAALADFGMAGVMARVGDNDASDAVSWWREYRTTAVNGNMASLSWGGGPFKWCLSEHLPVIRWHVKTGNSLTALRLWCGLFDTIPSPGSDTQAGQVGILFRYSTVAGDPGWVGFTSKFLGGNANSVSAKVADIAVNTVYDLQLRVVSLTSVAFSVNGGPEVFLTTNIPILGQYGGFGMGPILAVETREAVVKSLFVSRGYFEAN